MRILPLEMHYLHVRPVLIVFFAAWMGCPLVGQSASADPLILQVRVVEGEGMMYATGARATRGITVEVTDELGKAVGGVTLSFRLPEQGATGVFQNGTKTEIVTSDPNGRASVWGMRWNKTPGSVVLQITAVKGQTRAGTTVTQNISEVSLIPAAQRNDPYQAQARRRWIWISLVAAGAAGGGLALGARSAKTTVAPQPVVSLSIGRPTITIGAAP